MEHKDVPLHGQPGVVGQIKIHELVPFLNGYVIGGPVYVGRDGIFPERVVGGQIIVHRPNEHGTQMSQKLIDGILPPFHRQPGFRNRLERLFEPTVEENNFPVPILVRGHLKHGVFLSQIFHKIMQGVRGYLVHLQVRGTGINEEPF